MVKTEEVIDRILKLSWTDLDHEKVKLRLSNLFREMGSSVTPEYLLKGYRNQYIDLVTRSNKTGFLIGIEIDQATPRFKSVEKLRKLRPGLALMVLRSTQIPRNKIWQKVHRFPSNFVVLNLAKKCVVFSNFSLVRSERTKELAQKIVRIGEKRDSSKLVELFLYLSHKNGNIRRLACSALGKIGSPVAERPLVGMLFDSKPQVRQYTIKALGKTGSEYSLPILKRISISKTEKEYNIKAANKAIGQIRKELRCKKR